MVRSEIDRAIDMLGARCGRLTVVARALSYVKPDGSSHLAKWRCVCSCGGTVVKSGHSLRKGTIRSCDCLRVEENKRRAKRRL
jgi:hypothetical protein